MIKDDWMQKALCPSDDYRDHPVWMALRRYRIGPEKADLPFARRLARENGWSDHFSARVIEEYKRFCFLAVTEDSEMTPSDAVDQAWHLHLTYSHDYWERFCPHILGRPLHHGPTTGGSGTQARYFEQYAQTLKAYEAMFGELPAADIWPNGALRMIEDARARRVHPRDGIFVPRPAVRGAFAILGVILLLVIVAGALLR